MATDSEGDTDTESQRVTVRVGDGLYADMQTVIDADNRLNQSAFIRQAIRREIVIQQGGRGADGVEDLQTVIEELRAEISRLERLPLR